MIHGNDTNTELMTAEQLLHVTIPNRSTELVRGRLLVSEPPGTYHGRLQSNVHIAVGTFVREHQLGAVFGQDTGFRIASDPDTVRAPDLAFVAAERVPLIGRRGYAALAPDLVVEILSPDDRPAGVLMKIGEFLGAGTRLAWVLDSDRAEAHVYRDDGSVAIVGTEGALEGEQLLPGFTCPLRSVFE